MLLPSGTYFGWSFLAVLAAGTAAFWRDRRLWFFGFVLVVCGVFSLGIRRGQWMPARLFDHVPVLENVIQQRFMAIGFLVAAVMLALILEHVYALLPDWRGAFGALLLSAVSLVPMGVIFGERLPFTMRPGDPAAVVPDGGADAAAGARAAVVPGAVLGDPVGHGLAGGEPHALQPGRRRRAPGRRRGGRGPRARGFKELTILGLAVGAPPPKGTPAQLAAVRYALGRLAGDHRGHRDQPRGPARTAGERPGLCRRVHDGGARPAPDAPGGRLGLERRAGRPAGPAAPEGRCTGHLCPRGREARRAGAAVDASTGLRGLSRVRPGPGLRCATGTGGAMLKLRS